MSFAPTTIYVLPPGEGVRVVASVLADAECAPATARAAVGEPGAAAMVLAIT